MIARKLIVLIFALLAYSATVARAQVTGAWTYSITPSNSTNPPWEPVGCVLGNHGAIRGRPRVLAGKTLLADDGCMIVQLLDSSAGARYPDTTYTQSYLQTVVGTGNFNSYRLEAFEGSFLDDSAAGRTLSENIALIDAVLAAASQGGWYVYLNVVNETSGSCNNQDFAQDAIDWQTLAPRYANNTNVFYGIGSEPDGCIGSGGPGFDTIASQTASLYKQVRAAAPNTPILIFQFLNPAWVFAYDSGPVGEAQAAGIPSSDNLAVIDFHSYDGDQIGTDGTPWSHQFNTVAHGGGYATMETEGTQPCINLGAAGNPDAFSNITNYWEPLTVSWTVAAGGGAWSNSCGDAVSWPKD